MGNSYNPRIVTNGLALYLDAANPKSYPGSGTTWKDLSGNGNDGTLVNGVGYDSANSGSMVFDGVNQYVVTGDSGIVGNVPWTLSVWVNVDITENGSGRQGWIIWEGSRNQDNDRLISLGVNDGSVEVAHWANDTIFRNSDISFGEFQNIIVTFDGSIEKIYIDSVNTDNKSTTLNITNGAWYIASRAGRTGFLQASISNVQIYNRALTEAEIKQNYNALKGRYGL